MFPAHLFHSGYECNTQGGDELSGCQADHQLPELETCAEIEEGMRAVVTPLARSEMILVRLNPSLSMSVPPKKPARMMSNMVNKPVTPV